MARRARWRPALVLVAWAIAASDARAGASGSPPAAQRSTAAETRVRFSGPLRWDWLGTDSCGTRADGLLLEGVLEVTNLAPGDTAILVQAQLEEGGNRLELPACCACQIWHPTQEIALAPPGPHRFAFEFCGPGGRGREAVGPGRFVLRAGRYETGTQFAAVAETTLALPAIPARRFLRPRHEIVETSERPTTVGLTGRVRDIEVLARVTTDCAEPTRLVALIFLGEDPIEITTGAVPIHPPSTVVPIRLDGRWFRRARRDGPYEVRISEAEGDLIGERNEVRLRTRAYRADRFAPLDVELRRVPAAVKAVERSGRVSLQVEVPIEVHRAGRWRLSAALPLSRHNTLDALREVSLEPWQRTVVLSFDAAELYRRGLDGPYVLREVTFEPDVDPLPAGAFEPVLRDSVVTQSIPHTAFAPR